MIYRVIASSTAPDWKDREAMERVVFFEAHTRVEAHQRLKDLLSALWAVSPETIEYYNLDDELEMISYSIGGDETGDHRFFESGAAHGQPMYVGGNGHPLMLLHRSLDRMMAAYFTLPHRGESGLRIHLGKFD
ncbi:MAG: hypothetical protein ACOKSU_21875 [Pseudomonas sp.]|uniref:hypothetical protein n=1 Tax=Pseudomonas TaxID=286 RepID=UPI0003C0A323|nr:MULTISPECIES: hypothetical protein [Pseudomonas]AGZ38115.1 hypothetical protein PVLB_26892 [Pseudomonas sp. VLB120]